jgi:hypothetical protein
MPKLGADHNGARVYNLHITAPPGFDLANMYCKHGWIDRDPIFPGERPGVGGVGKGVRELWLPPMQQRAATGPAGPAWARHRPGVGPLLTSRWRLRRRPAGCGSG